MSVSRNWIVETRQNCSFEEGDNQYKTNCSFESIQHTESTNLNIFKIKLVCDEAKNSFIAAEDLIRLHVKEQIGQLKDDTEKVKSLLLQKKDDWTKARLGDLANQYAIPKMKMLCNLHCLKARLKLLCNK